MHSKARRYLTALLAANATGSTAAYSAMGIQIREQVFAWDGQALPPSGPAAEPNFQPGRGWQNGWSFPFARRSEGQVVATSGADDPSSSTQFDVVRWQSSCRGTIRMESLAKCQTMDAPLIWHGRRQPQIQAGSKCPSLNDHLVNPVARSSQRARYRAMGAFLMRTAT